MCLDIYSWYGMKRGRAPLPFSNDNSINRSLQWMLPFFRWFFSLSLDLAVKAAGRGARVGLNWRSRRITFNGLFVRVASIRSRKCLATNVENSRMHAVDPWGLAPLLHNYNAAKRGFIVSDVTIYEANSKALTGSREIVQTDRHTNGQEEKAHKK